MATKFHHHHLHLACSRAWSSLTSQFSRKLRVARRCRPLLDRLSVESSAAPAIKPQTCLVHSKVDRRRHQPASSELQLLRLRLEAFSAHPSPPRLRRTCSERNSRRCLGKLQPRTQQAVRSSRSRRSHLPPRPHRRASSAALKFKPARHSAPQASSVPRSHRHSRPGRSSALKAPSEVSQVRAEASSVEALPSTPHHHSAVLLRSPTRSAELGNQGSALRLQLAPFSTSKPRHLADRRHSAVKRRSEVRKEAFSVNKQRWDSPTISSSSWDRSRAETCSAAWLRTRSKLSHRPLSNRDFREALFPAGVKGIEDGDVRMIRHATKL